MMADVAELAIKADSSGIVAAAGDLKRLEQQAAKTESATGAMAETAAKATRSFSVFGDGVRGLVTSLAGLVGAGATFRTIIGNTIEQERAVTQLNAALRATGQSSTQASEQIQQMASALQRVTTFGDETILKSSALLLTFRQIGGDVFPRAQKAALDVATALGKDLQTATMQVGRALQDPIAGLAALSRSGIQFSDAQKETIRAMVETGRVAEAQGVILRELEQRYGGSAQAAAQTFGGSIQQLKNAFGDLLEGGGGNLTQATQGVQRMTEVVSSPAVQGAFASLTGAVLRTVAAVAEFGAGAVRVVQESGARIGAFIDTTTAQFAGLAVSVQAAIMQVERAIRSGFASVLDGVAAQIERLASLAERVPFGRSIADQMSTAAAAARQFGADTVAAADASIAALRREQEQIAQRIRISRETRDAVIADLRAQQSATADVVASSIDLQAAVGGVGEASAQSARGGVAEMTDRLAEQIQLHDRIIELALEGMDVGEARWWAEYEAADQANRVLMERKRLIDEIAQSQREAERMAQQSQREAERAAQQMQREAERAAEAQARAYERTAKGIEDAFRSVFRSVLDGSFSLSRSLRQWMDDLLTELALMAARRAIVIPVVTGAMGAMGFSDQAMAGVTQALGGGGLGGGIIGAVAEGIRLGFGGNGILGAFQGGADALVTRLAAGVEAIGSRFGIDAAQAFGANLGANAGAIGNALGAMGLAATTALAGRAAIRSDSRIGGNLFGAAAGVASMVNPLAGLAVVGGGLLDRAAGGNIFGTRFQTVAQDITLSIEEGIVEAMMTTVQSRRRSLGRGTRWREWSEAINAEVFQAAVDSLAEVAAAGRSLGLTGGSLDGQFTASASEAPQLIERIAEQIGTQMIPAFREMVRAGESMSDAFARLIGQAQMVSQSLGAALPFFQRGALVELSDELAQRFGEQLPAALDAASRLLLSSEEQFRALERSLTAVLGPLPETREGLRQLFELASDPTFIGNVIALAPALERYYSALESQAEVVGPASEAVEQASRVLADLMAEAERLGIELLRATGQMEAAEAAARELATRGMTEAEIAAYDMVESLRAQIAAAREASAEQERLAQEQAARQAQIAQERSALEEQLFRLTASAAEVREREREALDESNRALYDRIAAIQDERAAAAEAAREQERAAAEAMRMQQAVASQRAQLERQIMQLQGDTAAIRDLERAAIDASNLALFDRITALREEQAAAAEAARAAQEAERARAQREQAVAAQRAQLERELLSLSGDTAAIRAMERAAVDASNLALFDRIAALRQEQAAAAEAARAAQELAAQQARVAAERTSLETRLLQLQGDTAALRAREMAATDESNRDILQRIYSLQDEQAAAAEAARVRAESERMAQAENAAWAQMREQARREQEAREQEALRRAQAVASERERLEAELQRLMGNTQWLRAREREAIDESNRALFDRITALQRQAEIDRERAGLEQRLFQLTADTAAMRARELEALDPSNRELLQRIHAIEDEREATRAAADAERALAAARGQAEQELRSAYQREMSELDRIISQRDEAVQALRRAFAAEREEMAANAAEFSRFGSAIGSFVERARGQIAGASGAVSVDSFLRLASRAALGDRAALAGVAQAGDAALRAAEQTAGSAEEQAIATARIVDAAQRAQETADRQADIATQQLERLDAQLAALLGVQDAAQSVADAIARLQSADAAATAAAEQKALLTDQVSSLIDIRQRQLTVAEAAERFLSLSPAAPVIDPAEARIQPGPGVVASQSSHQTANALADAVLSLIDEIRGQARTSEETREGVERIVLILRRVTEDGDAVIVREAA